MQSVINTATAATVRQISHTNTHTHKHTCASRHMHLHNYTRTQTNTYILTLTHKCKCARACNNMHSHTIAAPVVTACPPPTNTQGLTMKRKRSLFADTFLPFSLCLWYFGDEEERNILSICFDSMCWMC